MKWGVNQCSFEEYVGLAGLRFTSDSIWGLISSLEEQAVLDWLYSVALLDIHNVSGAILHQALLHRLSKYEACC